VGNIGIRYHDYSSWRIQPYGTSWRLGSEQVGSSTAVPTDILSSNESASDISHPFTPVSCTVDSRYPKNSMIVIFLSNHQRDEL